VKAEPTKQEFEELLIKTHEHARKHGLTEKDLEDAIRKAREEKCVFNKPV